MKNKRVYPRIRSDWELFLSAEGENKPIGHVRDISLSGALLEFSENYALEPGKHKFSLKIINKQLHPPELVIVGLKEWEITKGNEVYLGIVLDRMEIGLKSSLMRFLSRSDKLQVQAYLIEAGSETNSMR
jgi:hypothetical protein